MALVAATALVTGIVMASRSKPDETAAAASAVKNPAQPVAQVTARPRVPEQVVVKACNDHAAMATGPRDKTVEVVKDGAVGALLGAAVGPRGCDRGWWQGSWKRRGHRRSRGRRCREPVRCERQSQARCRVSRGLLELHALTRYAG